MRTRRVLAGLALGLGLAVPAAAQAPAMAPAAGEEMSRAGEDHGHRGPAPRGGWRGHHGRDGAPGSTMAGWHRGYHRGSGHHGRPLFGFVMRHRQELGLTPDQMQSFQRLAADFRREAIKREADVKLARVDLGTLLRPDPTNPGKPVDMTLAEAKIREIERARGDMMLSRLRAMEQGKALLTPEQRAKLVSLLQDGLARPHRG